MSAIVVWFSVVVGVGFALAYVFSPRIKTAIEYPKYVFQKQLQQYDSQQSEQDSSAESSNETE
jgi:hypothetical protein